MDIAFLTKNFKIQPLELSNFETAWKIKDIPIVLQYCFSKKIVVLGGDILNFNKQYNYDNWYYNFEEKLGIAENSENSYNKAIRYINEYIKKNGEAFYVIIVTK